MVVITSLLKFLGEYMPSLLIKTEISFSLFIAKQKNFELEERLLINFQSFFMLYNLSPTQHSLNPR